jgi:hypothetical protein
VPLSPSKKAAPGGKGTGLPSDDLGPSCVPRQNMVTFQLAFLLPSGESRRAAARGASQCQCRKVAFAKSGPLTALPEAIARGADANDSTWGKMKVLGGVDASDLSPRRQAATGVLACPMQASHGRGEIQGRDHSSHFPQAREMPTSALGTPANPPRWATTRCTVGDASTCQINRLTGSPPQSDDTPALAGLGRNHPGLLASEKRP